MLLLKFLQFVSSFAFESVELVLGDEAKEGVLEFRDLVVELVLVVD